MKKTLYRYFVSCNVRSSTINGMMNLETQRDTPITCINDIIELSRNLEQENEYPMNSVTVLFYREFDD